MFIKPKYFLLSSIALLGGCGSASAQHSFLASEDVAVFYPKGYDASQHSPSPIFLRELAPIGDVPTDWKIRPHFSVDSGKSIAIINTEPDVGLYGTGEVTGDLRRNGTKIQLWNFDNPSYQLDNGTHLYQSHPWVIGVRPDGSAFGIIADNTWKSEIDLTENVRFESEGPAFRVIVIEKETPQALLATLADLTGHMEMPPLWALGYQQCRWSYNPDTRVKEIADSLRHYQIPADVIWLDIDYMDKFKIFTFNKEEFPNPKGLNDYLHAKNFKAVYMIDPGVKVEEGYFVDDQGSEADYWVKDENGEVYEGKVWPGACHFPDFTRPEVRSWWSSLYPDFMAQGIDGVWNDMNEPAVFDVGTMPSTNQHQGGDGLTPSSHLRYHNVYGYNMVKASREGILRANPNKRPFLLTRANFLGGHRYAATWTGDNASTWEHMEMSVPMTITLGLSGQPFNGPDIGGFAGDATPELLANWTAIGVYFPFVRNHSIKGSVDQEPWVFGDEVLDVCRTAINRRYRLMPYIYTLFREASVDGMPVMRPLFFADIKDLSLRNEQQAFLLGNDLIVIPRWAEKTAMPKGDWKRLALEEKDDKYQAHLFQRPGSIIPLANLYQNTEEYNTDSLTLLVNLGTDNEATGILYEDAGDGFGYKKGEYAKYEAKAKLDGKQLTVSLSRVGGEMKTNPKRLRIGFVTDGKIIYSPWIDSSTVTMKI
ncbi:MAG: DUF5110 domain-containing protein [Muribaculaceae bacterium]|nr:DUF5110 domain-containing protein [Muribaculaceae bacterium]